MIKTAIVCYWHTLRYLRPVQIWGRLWFRLYQPKPDLSEPPSLRETTASWFSCPRFPSMPGPETFRFLNHEASVTEPGDWHRDDGSLLWLYHLHYFDDLNADGAEARWLRKRLEIHLLGNHLWANAKALVFGGTFFEGDEADAWRQKGLALIRRELDEQILADGGHFERSPMYHAIVLEDLLDLVQLAQCYPMVFPENDTAACLQDDVEAVDIRLLFLGDGARLS